MRQQPHKSKKANLQILPIVPRHALFSKKKKKAPICMESNSYAKITKATSMNIQDPEKEYKRSSIQVATLRDKM
ncbi:unnamed protein product [Brassica rapa subsp. trilocularis]